MSNLVGAGGHEIAHELSERTEWPIFHKELLLEMARNETVRAQLYATMDERDVGWVEEALRSILEVDFKRNDYFPRLTETVLMLARQGHAIFLGRAADLILPRNRGLRVKILASPRYRTQSFARYSKVSEEEARQAIQRIEQERNDFVNRHFPKCPDDYSRFDLLISAERFDVQQAVEIIVSAMQFRGIITPR
jgi:cytidylate kinase